MKTANEIINAEKFDILLNGKHQFGVDQFCKTFAPAIKMLMQNGATIASVDFRGFTVRRSTK